MDMRKPFLRFSALLFLFAGVLTCGAARAQGVLPGSFAGRTGERSGAQLQSLDGFTVPSASVLKEYELGSIEAQNYADASGSYKVLLYKMKDPTGAYGLYSYLRSGDMERADAAAHSSMSNERALVLVGNLVIEVRGKDLQKHGADLNAGSDGETEVGGGPVAAIDGTFAGEGIRGPVGQVRAWSGGVE
jgi:hypothetical protein